MNFSKIKRLTSKITGHSDSKPSGGAYEDQTAIYNDNAKRQF